jgi:ribosomal protein L12E/L44/L45/RPP1/RPP2
MEKIVQLPITIPPPTKGGRKSYVESLTGFREWNAAFAQILENGLDAPDRGLGIGLAAVSRIKEMATQQGAEPKPLDETEVKQYMGELEGRSLGEVEAKSAKALAEAAPEKRRAAAEASKRMYAQTFSERDPAMAEFVNEVADLVDGNPRQIKRYVNVFRFYSTLRHSLRVDGTVAADELPSDKVLAKFVALSIQWPHAVDCLRVRKDAKAGAANGHKVTVLELLESESRKPATDIAATDEAWEKYVGKDGLGLGTWAAKRTFREFMARGESLCQKEGHGLW